MDPRSSADLQLALSQRKEGEDVALDFANADLRGNRVVRADLSGGDFSGARLEHVNLSGAKCFGTRFNRAQLQGAILNGADLTGANLRGADLSQAKLEGACLAQTDCTAANLGHTSGMPSSVAGMRFDTVTVKRSKLTDEQVIELYRQGATLLDLEQFSPKVRQHCALDQLPTERVSIPVRRQVSLEEFEGHCARISRDLSRERAQSLPPSFQRILSHSMRPNGNSDHPHAIPRSYILAEVGDEILGAKLVARLPATGPMQRFEAKNRDGVRCVVVLYDPGADPSGIAFAAFRRGVRNLGRIGELGETTQVRIPEVLGLSIDELGYVARELWNGDLANISALRWNQERLLVFFKEICRSVTALHELGIVHRCLCPSTVLIGDDLKPVLTDIDAIDLVELVRRGESELDHYAAPEELKGLSAYSPTADVFSLGKILYFLLAGERPVAGPLTDKSMSFPRGTSRGIVRIVYKAIQLHPTNRYPQVADLLADLAHHQDADQVGCDGPLPEEEAARGVISIPPSRRRDGASLAQYPALSLDQKPSAPLAERFMRLWGPRLGALGAGLAAACLLVGVLAPSLTFDAAKLLVVALSACLGLSLLWVPLPRPVAPRMRILLALLTGLVVYQVDLQRLMSVRWSLTLHRGSVEQRALTAKNLVRSGKRDLHGIDLSDANLAKVDFANANLRGARFVKANLNHAMLAEADLTGAKLNDCDLRGANLELTNAAQAEGWPSVVCDNHTRMPEGWLCLEGKPAAQPE